MFKTVNSVGTLKTIAFIVGLALVLWSLGLPSLKFASAANLTNVSNTISDSDIEADSDHHIRFNATNGVGTGESITVTFPSKFLIGDVDHTDIQLIASGTPQTIDDTVSGATWGVSFNGHVLTITSGTETIGAGEPVEILIGLNAGGTNQIQNPDEEGSYRIEITSGSLDKGATNVVILEAITVTATVETIFNFTVAGLGSGEMVNGTSTTGVASSTAIPFGVLESFVASTTAHELTVSTNASAGYVVTVQLDGYLRSVTGDYISSFSNGSDTDTPSPWAAPGNLLADDDTWGHWGVTSEDDDIPGRLTQFGSGEYISASTTPRTVMGHNGPADGSTAGVGRTKVGYTIEISPLQSASEYSATLTYVATPTF